MVTIRDHVEVIGQPTVVRLDQLQGPNSGWISDSYYITGETERHFEALKVLLSKETGSGMFLIGHYGSGKSHFLAYLTQRLETGNFASCKPAVLPLSLLNYKADQSLESILDEALAITHISRDRREAWKQIQNRYPDGLFLIIDELSEFLRSKPSAKSYNEDLRFLQFLGEWAQGSAFWILAALQEQIEHAGDIEYDLYRKIKDRYPFRFLLTPAHVKDLISGRILRKKATYSGAVEHLAKELMGSYPPGSIDYADFCEIYPLHPVTLELLEEVRDRFSQARGIIDFTLTRLLGSEARGIEPFLDRPWGHLITPDLIVDHFSDLFEVQPEFLAIAQKVFPYFRKNIPLLFETDLQRELAWRLLKLLILVHLSPRRQSLNVQDAAFWLLLRVSSIDPGKNVDIIQRIFDVLSEKGAYISRRGKRYRLDLADESKENLEHLLSKEVEEMKTRGESIFEELLPLLEGTDFNPFSLPRHRWHTRKIRWHFHDRDVRVYFGGGVPPEETGLALQIGLPWGPIPEGIRYYKILPNRLEATPDILELAALFHLRERPLPAAILTHIQERIEGRKSWFVSMIRAVYSEAVVMDPTDMKSVPPPGSMQSGLTGWLNAFGEWILRQTYPMSERFAPGYGPLPKEAYREFMKYASEQELGAEDAPEFVKLIREAYLVPMGLMQRRKSDYILIARLENHDLVRLLTPLIEHHPSPGRIYEHLGAPPYGLVSDQVHLLLLTLLIQGEIDIVKGQRSYRDSYDTLPTPLQYDQVLPGHALNLNELRDLQALCDGFRIPVPRQWTVLAQKRTIHQLRNYGGRQRERLSDFLTTLKAHGEADDLAAQVEKGMTQWLALEKGAHELQGFQHFLFEIGSPQRFLAEATEMSTLPDRFEKLLVESRRFRHLFGYESITQCENVEISVGVEALGQPPSWSDPEALQTWINRGRDIYARYQEWYRKRHEEWWDVISRHALWSVRPPNISRSKHIGAADLMRDLESLQSKAKTARCRGLSNLEFQPVCWCGYDGKESPVSPVLLEFETKVKLLETELELFFQQEKVRARVQEWIDQKLEMNSRTLSYLEGTSAYPETENIALLDQHLSGVELTKTVEASSVFDFLGEGVWEKSSLLKALDQFLNRFGTRFRFHKQEPAPRKELVAWCCQQALRHGSRLPSFFTPAEYASIPALLQHEWISESSLNMLDQMGLGEAAINSIVGMLLEGMVRMPEGIPEEGPVAAALQLLRPQQATSAAQLARQVQVLYQQHERMVKLRPQIWLARLNDVAETKLEAANLQSLLQKHLEAQWVVVDCFGLPLLSVIQEVSQDSLSRWKTESVEFALVSHQSSTDAFYLSLLENEIKKPFRKINAVDDLIHNRNLDYNSLITLARAELQIAFRKIAPMLDSSMELIIFGDHGFRLDRSGVGFCHGGPSTLERLTPVVTLVPLGG